MFSSYPFYFDLHSARVIFYLPDSDIFVDGTFKYCTKFFHQPYTIHECKNGHYVPLVFALLPAKTELCYRDLWTKIQHLCTKRDLHLNPSSIHVDFEPAMHNVIVALFPDE